MTQPTKYKAKDKHGNWITGWYVEHHIAKTDSHDRLVGYDVVPCIFNDEPNNRSKGSYWHEIDPTTIVANVQQLKLDFEP